MSSRMMSGRCLLQQRHGVDTILGGQHPHAVALQQALRDAAYGDRVVDDQSKGAPVALVQNHGFRRAGAPFGTHQRAHVENDDDAAVAQDRRAGDAADSGYLRAQGLHDDFPAADQFIGDQGRGMLAGADQHHRNRNIRFRKSRRTQAHERTQLLEAILLSAVLEQRRVLAQMPGDDVARQTHHAFHGRQRQGINLFADAHDQRLADRQRERQANGETRTLARRRYR